jgi:hypothetical protein
MTNIEFAPAAELARSSLDPDSVRKLSAWFGYLKCWDEDELGRKTPARCPAIRASSC